MHYEFDTRQPVHEAFDVAELRRKRREIEFKRLQTEASNVECDATRSYSQHQASILAGCSALSFSRLPRAHDREVAEWPRPTNTASLPLVSGMAGGTAADVEELAQNQVLRGGNAVVRARSSDAVKRELLLAKLRSLWVRQAMIRWV